MKYLDPDHPFFRPVWRRWATALFPGAWALIELWNGSPGWAVVFAAASAWAFWALILVGPKGDRG
jgi:hypothetical protein